MSYILSSGNRYYAAAETTFGQAQPVSSEDRVIGTHLQIRQTFARGNRRDKNGSRSYTVSMAGPSKTAFEFKAELTSTLSNGAPRCGPLVKAALGGDITVCSGLTVAAMPDTLTVQTQTAHSLFAGAGICIAGELRFVTSTVDASTMKVGIPFSTPAPAGTSLSLCSSYGLGTQLQSLSIYDYWDSPAAINRILAGAYVDEFTLSTAADSPALTFSGPAADVIDSSSITVRSGLAGFPQEPQINQEQYLTVSGHAGQVWLGQPAAQQFTLMDATVRIRNNVRVRRNEMGSAQPLAMQAGSRDVEVDLSIVTQTDSDSAAIYELAKARSPVPLLLQLGNVSGQIMAVCIKSLQFEVPEYDDSQDWLIWHFRGSWAQGVSEDEVYLAFA